VERCAELNNELTVVGDITILLGELRTGREIATAQVFALSAANATHAWHVEIEENQVRTR